ncbi:hypothetical protein LINPERHAP1_LOCUS7537 [Linum perenne]
MRKRDSNSTMEIDREDIINEIKKTCSCRGTIEHQANIVRRKWLSSLEKLHAGCHIVEDLFGSSTLQKGTNLKPKWSGNRKRKHKTSKVFVLGIKVLYRTYSADRPHFYFSILRFFGTVEKVLQNEEKVLRRTFFSPPNELFP